MGGTYKGWAAVARLGGIGDNLIAASVLRPLKKLGYMVEVISAHPNHVVYYNNPYVDKLSVKFKGDLPEGDHMAWLRWFEARKKEYEVFAHMSHTCEALHAFFTGSSQFWWPASMRRKIARGSYLETVHDMAEVPYEFGPLFFPTEEEYDRAAEVRNKIIERHNKTIIGWVISGSRIDKIYPSATLAISRIIRELGATVILLGAANEKEISMAESIFQIVEKQNSTKEGILSALTSDVSLTDDGYGGDWPIRRSLTQLQYCDLVVTPDTGLAWSVAFEKVPKVAMVSHASAENITKHWINTITLHADPNRVPCWPCHRLHDGPETCVPNQDNNGASCISDISVECLVTAIKGGLGCQESLSRLKRQWSSSAEVSMTNSVPTEILQEDHAPS
jgi:ADP-heptose:LPS heptosyltransferase